MVAISPNKLLRKITPRWLLPAHLPSPALACITTSGGETLGGHFTSSRQEALFNAVIAGGLGYWLDELQEQVPAETFFDFVRSARDVLRPIVDQGRRGASQGAMNYAISQVVEMFCNLPESEEMCKYLEEKASHAVVASGTDYRQELFNQVVRLHLQLKRLSCRPRPGMMQLQCSMEMTEAGSKVGYIEMCVFFITSRKPSGRSEPRSFFSTARGTDVTYGTAVVSMPDFLGLKDKLCTHPPHWVFLPNRAVGKNSRKVVVSKLMTVSQPTAATAIRKTAARADSKEALVFVHGYNTRFLDAIKRLAAAAYTMAWSGPIILYSWPSFESLQWYTGDEANAMWSVTHFEEQVRFLTSPACGLSKLDFLAHSMGSRVLIYGLTRFDPGKQPEGAAKLGRVVLAAPDFDTWEFHLMAEAFCEKVEHVTIYCASDDSALKMSTTIHGGYPRLGDFRWSTSLDTKERALISLDKIDIIDATGLDSSLLGPHHGYIFSQTVVVHDLFEHLRSGSLALNRPNTEARQTSFGRNYFVLKASEASGKEELLRLWSSGTSSSGSSNPPSPQSVLEEQEETPRSVLGEEEKWDSELTVSSVEGVA